jgi:hypothetical protein
LSPAISTISAAQTLVNVKRIAGIDGAGPSGDHLREVIWMDSVAGTPSFQFFKGPAKIFQGLAVDMFYLSVRSHDGYQAGNAVSDQASTPVAPL